MHRIIIVSEPENTAAMHMNCLIHKIEEFCLLRV